MRKKKTTGNQSLYEIEFCMHKRKIIFGEAYALQYIFDFLVSEI